jgi:hypothetical protein
MPVGAREIEKRPQQAIPDEHGLGISRQRECPARSSPGDARDGGRSHGIRNAATHDERCDLGTRERSEHEAGAAAADSRQQQGLVLDRQHDAYARGRLLEGLQERVLRIRVHALGTFDDGKAVTTLEWKERERRLELVDLSESNLATRAGRREPVHVGVRAVVDLSAGAACAAWPRSRIFREAQQARREIQRQRRLSNAARTYQHQRVRRSLRDDGAPNRLERARVSAGAKDGLG